MKVLHIMDLVKSGHAMRENAPGRARAGEVVSAVLPRARYHRMLPTHLGLLTLLALAKESRSECQEWCTNPCKTLNGNLTRTCFRRTN